MAYRATPNLASCRVNVVMKNGTKYLGCDLAENNSPNAVVTFWFDNAIRIVPLQDVLYADIYEDKYDAKSEA
jgi:hypothetical protein